MKNCYTCKHLEWVEGEDWDPKGWVCTNRKYRTDKEENSHVKLLDSITYRLKGKKCCRLKETELSTV